MNTSLRILFAGTPAFAEVVLRALLNANYQIAAVYTQPDRPAGRGLKLNISPVKQFATEHGLTVAQPASLKDGYQIEKIKNYQADVMVVAAYGLLLPQEVLSAPKYGCINIHPSLLPRWRGPAPIPRTIMAGDSISGVTIMQMDSGLDTGDILLKEQYVLEPDETSQTLHDRLAEVGANALLKTLSQLQTGALSPEAQDSAMATYAHKLSKEEALIDWQLPAIEIERMIRAFNPWPVAYTSWKNQNLRIWQAKVINHEETSDPRTILAASNKGIDIATGRGILRLLKLQLPGGKVVAVNDFYNAKQADIKIGEHLV